MTKQGTTSGVEKTVQLCAKDAAEPGADFAGLTEIQRAKAAATALKVAQTASAPAMKLRMAETRCTSARVAKPEPDAGHPASRPRWRTGVAGCTARVAARRLAPAMGHARIAVAQRRRWKLVYKVA